VKNDSMTLFLTLSRLIKRLALEARRRGQAHEPDVFKERWVRLAGNSG